ncbi:MAG TPA: flagellar protein FlgN [Sphingobacteriaceae bacterium]|nr:flagellar protein FlgN [Sphingobacteriaceae bacterium]
MAPAADGVQQLTQLLTRTADVYEALAEAAQTTTRRLEEQDPVGLLSTTAEADALLAQARELEEQRQPLVDSLLAARNLPPDTSLSDLLAAVEHKPGPLHRAYGRLREAVLQLQDACALNRRLLENGLAYVQFSLRLLSDAVGTPIYGDSGRSHGLPGGRGFVDVRG